MSNLWNLVLIVILSIANTRSITVRNGAYHNIVVEIEKDVPADECFNILLSLEVRLFLTLIDSKDFSLIFFPPLM